MKLFVKEKCEVKETEVEIRCRTRDREVDALIAGIKNAASFLVGEKENGDLCQVPVARIFYFEAIEGRYLPISKKILLRSEALYMKWKALIKAIISCGSLSQ